MSWKTGYIGEDMAARFLEDKGYTILDRNYHFERAEIDIVAYQGRDIVFVEVKTRNSDHYGQPEEAVDQQKKKQLFKVAEAWMHERKMVGAPARFDVVSIMHPGSGQPRIKHFEAAFWYF